MKKHHFYERSMHGWYRRNPYFLRYMLREGTAVFLAVYALLLLAGLMTLVRGPEAFAGFMAFLRSPFSIALHLIIFIAACYHSYTWFAVSPKAMPVLRLGKRRVPDRIVIAAQYLLLALVTTGVLVLVRGD